MLERMIAPQNDPPIKNLTTSSFININSPVTTTLRLSWPERAPNFFAPLLVVEAGALNCIGEDRQAVQLRAGHDAYRGIFGLKDLSEDHDPDLVGNVTQSRLTWLLRDVFFGQNVKCTVLLCLSRKEKEKKLNKYALELLERLGSLRTTPVPFEPKAAQNAKALRREALQLRRVKLAAML